MLASMPLEQELAGGSALQSTTYCIVFVSIVLTSLLSFFIERTRLSRLYDWPFRKAGFGREAQPAPVTVSILEP